MLKLPQKDRLKIERVIEDLPNNPYPVNSKPLQGKLKEYLRVRVGDFRVIYTIEKEELIILIVAIGSRGDIYK